MGLRAPSQMANWDDRLGEHQRLALKNTLRVRERDEACKVPWVAEAERFAAPFFSASS